MSKTANSLLSILDRILSSSELDQNEINRSYHYSEIVALTKKITNLNEGIAKKIFNICQQDLVSGSKHCVCALKTINIVLKKIEDGKCPSGPYVIQSALSVICLLKKCCTVQNTNTYSCCMETLSLYPNSTYVELTTSHIRNLLSVFDFSALEQKWTHIEKPVQILIRILKTLAPELKEIFISEGLDNWFVSLLPAVMWPRLGTTHDIKDNVTALEMMIDVIVTIDYSNNMHWLQILTDICDENRYQKFLRQLVKEDNDCWHRLWIILIKLLKSDNTKVQPNAKSSPINILLPVVELGFRLDPDNRCRSFLCWNALIDNFSLELGNSDIAILNKRLKLLMTPLRLNNAKNEMVVLAKFETWWHLILRFESETNKIIEVVLFPFLHFCFGKAKDKVPVVSAPGLITEEVAKKCTEALVEIIGHVNCNGCSTMRKLNGKLINTNILVDNFNEWLHILGVAIRNLGCSTKETSAMQRAICIWKGFILTLSDLPENQLRADLFNEVLMFSKMLLYQNKLSLVVFNLLLSLFYDYEKTKIKDLLKTKGSDGPLYTILVLLRDPLLTNTFNMHTVDQLVAMLKPLTYFILDTTVVQTNDVIQRLFCNEVKFKNTVYLWAALIETICQFQKYVNPENLVEIVMWPLKNLDLFSANDSRDTWYKWYSLYMFVRPLVNNNAMDNQISNILTKDTFIDSDTALLTLSAALAVLKHKLISDDAIHYEEEALTLCKMINEIHNNEYVEKTMPILIDTISLLLVKITENENYELAKNCIEMVEVVLKAIKKDASNFIFKEKLLSKLKPLFLKDVYADLKTLLTCDERQISSPKIDFSVPKPVLKVTSEPNIVKTVVENGEEYVVVKSNWKFNPRKLTENQKEKLKRKREDIPALYQDLSQSQDEFKLKSWKSDSQDASSTNTTSKSNDNNDVITVITNIPSTDVVPLIMENLLSDNLRTTETLSEAPVENNLQKTPSSKELKTPKMALKDRVLRNVRNLIGKSSAQSDKVILPDIEMDMNQTFNENNLKTPENKTITPLNASNSAPSKICNRRPSRTIKTPRKFEDSEITPLKRQKRGQKGSSSQTQDCSEEIIEDPYSNIRTVVHNSAKNTNSSIENPAPHTDEASIVLNSEQPDKNYEDSAKEVLGVEVSSVKDTVISIQSESPVPLDSAITKQKLEISVKELGNTEANPHDKVSTVEPLKETDVASEVNVNNSEVIEDILTPLNIEKQLTNSEVIEEIVTPKPIKVAAKANTPLTSESKDQSTKKKRSRIEKQLLIDMVEGHPLLQAESLKRSAKKINTNDKDTVSKRRKSLIEKSSKIKAELEDIGIISKDESPAPELKANKEPSPLLIIGTDSQQDSTSSQDMPASEDVIESSQDSTLTTISVKTSGKKLAVVPALTTNQSEKKKNDTQSLLDNEIISLSDVSACSESKEDIELPKNKTMLQDFHDKDSTENMDTQPIESSSEVVIIENEQFIPIEINTENVNVGKETQEVADADTLPMDILNSVPDNDCSDTTPVNRMDTNCNTNSTNLNDEFEINNDTANASTQKNISSLSCTAEVLTDVITESSNSESPLKDNNHRKKDFLDNTIEISPIKTMSPVKEKTPSPAKTNDYVIKFTSPVQSNGEPFSEKLDSPEVFTEDKISPDKRNESPPRKSVVTVNGSPSSSLSLKKNRPQMRSNGRAAQMLGLCVPDQLQTSKSFEESKRNNPSPARRNLRVLYGTPGIKEDQANETDSSEGDNFLKFKRSLPTTDCSPSGPILKRKLAEISDEVAISPASKRKRVSFHDPPVSTTVSVQKYIEPCGIRSPQSSVLKRQERQARPIAKERKDRKSPKRLENVFKLETVLTKAVESFSDEPVLSNETQMSLDETPAAEVIKTSELNNTDPICPELVECKDHIDAIAEELSSATTKDLLVKELEGKVATVGDLAKMTELEVNRLCIKAPKVKVVKKVLTDYVTRTANDAMKQTTIDMLIDASEIDTPSAQHNEVLTNDMEMQTEVVHTVFADTQTDVLPTADASVQTNESGSKSTSDIVASCLVERPDFVQKLVQQLSPEAVRTISDKMPFEACISLLTGKMTNANYTDVLNGILEQNPQPGKQVKVSLEMLQNFLLQTCQSKDLILFCSQLLQKIYDKPT